MQNITDTGLRGYLKWVQQDQPNVYKIVAPMIAQRFPQAFSDHEQSVAFGFLADDASGTSTYFGDTPAFDTSASSGSTVDVAQAANTGASSPSLVNDIANLVSSVTTGLAKYQLTQAQIQAVNNVNQAQAAHAAAGGTPLQISSSSLNIPFISGISPTATTAVSSTLAVALGVGGLLWFLSKRKRAA